MINAGAVKMHQVSESWGLTKMVLGSCTSEVLVTDASLYGPLLLFSLDSRLLKQQLAFSKLLLELTLWTGQAGMYIG